ncbi:hypothetical protein ACFYV7_04350 [Nocardia suismassiliense]|uniref:Uncharacterized protein n=1 Tax=Nocardia suismassiliense TaxID=2077092 RepID=A0ABW6QM05_9NOCA
MTMTVRQRWVLAVTSVAALMTVLDALVVTTALPAIQRELHASIAVAYYLIDETGVYQAHSIHVLGTKDSSIERITVFLNRDLFPLFGLPLTQ